MSLEFVADASVAVDVAEDSGLTVYDAAYLELAKRKGLPLASRDAGLNTDCGRAGVPVLL